MGSISMPCTSLGPPLESAACFGRPEQSAVGQPRKELAAYTAGLGYTTLTAAACTQHWLASMLRIPLCLFSPKESL